MIDLVCVVADKNMEAALQGILPRHQSLGIREITFESIVHPQRDPGCFHHGAELLAGNVDRSRHGLLMLDLAWEGSPAETGPELETLAAESLASLPDDWAEIIVIDPELESWVFASSPHVATALSWESRSPGLRDALEEIGFWPAGRTKPLNPKRAVEWALWQVRKPRSSAIYRGLAEKVSLSRCEDRAFERLRTVLQRWFPAT